METNSAVTAGILSGDEQILHRLDDGFGLVEQRHLKFRVDGLRHAADRAGPQGFQVCRRRRHLEKQRRQYSEYTSR